jgi:glycosyltransferase involved in cell wall biosynthesis
MTGSDRTRAATLRDLRVAIVHYWLVGRAGGERVVEGLTLLFPQADIFTLMADEKKMPPSLRGQKITTSFLQKLPFAKRLHRFTLGLQPIALEQFDLSRYDLVLSSESGPAKGVITGPGTLHVCYCHSPMRYIWDMHAAYTESMRWPVRIVFRLVAHWMRVWDLASAARVDRFVANSRFIASRIRKIYRRSSTVIHPPVEVESAGVASAPGEYYLCAGRLVDYKRVDLAVEACRRMGRKLKVAGDGPLRKKLAEAAGPDAEFLGSVTDEQLSDLMLSCRALLFPGEEDFGIIPVEVQARGRPVIAYASGGVLETVEGLVDGDAFHSDATGIFFPEQNADSVMKAIERFEAIEGSFEPARIHQRAMRFDQSVFQMQMAEFLAEAWAEFQGRKTSDAYEDSGYASR